MTENCTGEKVSAFAPIFIDRLKTSCYMSLTDLYSAQSQGNYIKV